MLIEINTPIFKVGEVVVFAGVAVVVVAGAVSG